MKTVPLVSTIIPTYNRAGLVCRAVESVLEQTYSEIETIVVDDGSTDQTQTVLKKYGDKIRVLAQKNSGPSAARNRGISISRGEVITFLDSDDVWLPTKVERQVDILNRCDESVCSCLCNTTLNLMSGKTLTSFELARIDFPGDEVIWLNVLEVLAARAVQFNQGIAIRREVLMKVGGFDESLWCLEDYELALRLSLEGPWALVREPLAVWYEGSSGSLHKMAQDEGVRQAERYTDILRAALSKTRAGDHLSPVRRQLMWQINTTRWQLWVAQTQRAGFWRAVTLGKLLDLLRRCRTAAYRRSPWFPRVKALPIDSYCPERQRHEFAPLRPAV